MQYKRKINFNSAKWSHHRSGWSYVCSIIKEHLHDPNGILCDGVVELSMLDGKIYKQDWIGFIHATPYVEINDGLDRHQKKYFLEGMFDTQAWKKSFNQCRGIFVFSKYAKECIQERYPNLKICVLKHPTKIPEIKFTKLSNKIVFVGDWLRKIESIYNIKSNKEKILLDGMVGGKVRNQEEYRRFIYREDPVEILTKLSNLEFDELLSTSLVFTHLHDSSANNTIIECMARNTPILVNRLPAVVEYLGENYPLYFDDLDEAGEKSNDDDLIMSANKYLREMNKAELTETYFLQRMVNSVVYRDL